MDELNLLHPERDKRSSVRVLVPGCGLARLPFELAASHGYHSIANEQSYLMLFAGNFILNNCDRRQVLINRVTIQAVSNLLLTSKQKFCSDMRSLY